MIGSLQGFTDEQGQPKKGIIKNMRNREFTFFKPMRLPTLALVQLQLAGSPDDFEVPLKMTEILASGHASGVVTAQQVLTDDLRAPEFSLDGGASPRPIVKMKLEFDFATDSGKERYEEAITKMLTAFDRYVSVICFNSPSNRY